MHDRLVHLVANRHPAVHELLELAHDALAEVQPPLDQLRSVRVRRRSAAPLGLGCAGRRRAPSPRARSRGNSASMAIRSLSSETSSATACSRVELTVAPKDSISIPSAAEGAGAPRAIKMPRR